MEFSKSTPLKAAAAGLMLAGLTGQAHAVTILDTYIGGNNPASFVGADVVAGAGDTRFNITSMDVTRLGNSLNIVINTNYSGENVGAGGTTLGDLFLGQIGNLSSTAFSNTNDTYVADKDRFSHVFDFNEAPNTGPSNAFYTNDAPANQGGNATLYTLLSGASLGTDVLLTQDLVSGGIRRDQAVDIKETAKTAATKPATGTWSTTAGSVTFNIADFFLASTLGAVGGMYNTGLIIGWGMTCANDYILAEVVFRRDNIPTDVPLPAGLLLFVSALAGIGVAGRFRKPAAGA